MALFGKNKKEKAPEKPAEKAAKTAAKKSPVKTAKAAKAAKVSKVPATVATADTAATALTSVIIAPHVTEKAGLANEKGNMYTFKVTKNATKHTISHEVKTKYKVTPTKVNIVILPGRQVFVRGKKGMQSGFKKAYVFLKKGDKIDFA